jgi:hypothetical protein
MQILDQGLNVINGYSSTTATASISGNGVVVFTGITASMTLSDATKTSGWTVALKNLTSPAGTVTVYPFGAQTIDGGASTTIASGSQKQFYSNGTNYYVIG